MARFDRFKTLQATTTTLGSPAPRGTHRSISRASRPEIIAMVVTGILGAIGLGALFHSVTRPQSEPLAGGMIVRAECIRIWLHPALDALARRLSEAELRSPEALARHAADSGISNAWYITTLRLTLADGKFDRI